MSRRMFKVLALGAVLASSLVAASSASATSWTSNGTAAGTAFTGAGSGTSLLIVKATSPTVHDVGISCTGATAAGTLFGPTNPGPTWSGLANVTPSFTGCTAAGIGATVDCTGGTSAKLNAVSWLSGTTQGNISGIHCLIYTGTAATHTCNINVVPTSGAAAHAVDGNYVNSTFKLTVIGGSSSGQTLTASWANVAPATACTTIFGTASGSGSAYFGSAPASGGFPGNLVYTVNSTFKPSITQP